MKNIIKILQLSKPLHGLLALLTFLILIVSALQLAIPFASKYAVDEITAKLSNQGGDWNKVVFFILIGFVVTIIQNIFLSVSNRLGDHFAGQVRKFLTEKFYTHILTLPQSYFDSEISGEISHQLTRGITAIQDFLNTASNFILPTFLQSIFTIIVLALFNPILGLFIGILFPIYILISRNSTKKWGEREEAKNKIEDSTRGRLHEVMSNIRLVKGYTNEKNEYNLISNNLSKINRIYAKQSKDFHIIDFIRNLTLHSILMIISIIIFQKAFQGEFTLGEVVLILQLIAQARAPLFGMSFIIERIQRAESDSKEYFEILDLESKDYFEEDTNIEKITDPKLEFKNIKFSYDDKNKVLEDISFNLVKNEVVALVGPSGAGKSTIINLILKFYEPTSGDIALNGKSYNDLSTNQIRGNIALVFQENELFSSTIRENVAYGKAEATDEQVVDALKKANAYEFVMALPDGINSEIGERGVRLSGGQKQRIQIARAILKDSPILILDEATSNLDAKSEFEVQEALEELMKERLTIIIAHRFSTLQNASKVIVLNNHGIEDMGTPQDLAKREGIYSELLHYQIEGNKKLLKKFEIY